MKRFSFTGNKISAYDGMEVYCYGQAMVFHRIVSSFTVGKIYQIKYGEVGKLMIETDLGDRIISDLEILDGISIYMLPLCLLTPKERFLFNLSGILPERFDEYVK